MMRNHTSLKRQQRALITSDELLDLLSDLYKNPLSVIYKENRHTCRDLKHADNQSCTAFYKDLMR